MVLHTATQIYCCKYRLLFGLNFYDLVYLCYHFNSVAKSYWFLFLIFLSVSITFGSLMGLIIDIICKSFFITLHIVLYFFPSWIQRQYLIYISIFYSYDDNVIFLTNWSYSIFLYHKLLTIFCLYYTIITPHVFQLL